MLRSELDDDVTLPELFGGVLGEVSEVREAVVSGQMGRDVAARRLSGLRISAPDGTLWTVGAQSLTWYRKLPGGRWTRTVPPLGDHVAYVFAPSVDPDDATPAGSSVAESHAAAPPPSADAVPSDDDLAAIVDGGGVEDWTSTLEALPELADDSERRPEGVHTFEQPPKLIEPGSTVRQVDDALGDEGRLSDDDLAGLSGQSRAADDVDEDPWTVPGATGDDDTGGHADDAVEADDDGPSPWEIGPVPRASTREETGGSPTPSTPSGPTPGSGGALWLPDALRERDDDTPDGYGARPEGDVGEEWWNTADGAGPDDDVEPGGYGD